MTVERQTSFFILSSNPLQRDGGFYRCLFVSRGSRGRKTLILQENDKKFSRFKSFVTDFSLTVHNSWVS